MSNETEAGTQTLDSSSDTIVLRLRQESEMDAQGIETSADELTLRLVDERIKQAKDPILGRVEDLYALLAGRTVLESAKNNETFNLRLDNTSASPSRNRRDSEACRFVFKLAYI